MKHYIISLIFCLMSLLTSNTTQGQNYANFIIDNSYNYYRDFVVSDFCDSLSVFNGEEYDFYVYSIVYLAPWATYIAKNDIIDTAAFTRQYFCSGQFFVDYIQKSMVQGGCYKFVYESYLCDIKNKQCYYFPRGWMSRDKNNQSLNPNKYLFKAFDSEYYGFVGELLRNGVLDCVFAYPSRVDQFENIILVPYPVLWGIKDNKFFVLDSGYGKESPKIYPVEDYIDCCWEEMTNLPRE